MVPSVSFTNVQIIPTAEFVVPRSMPTTFSARTTHALRLACLPTGHLLALKDDVPACRPRAVSRYADWLWLRLEIVDIIFTSCGVFCSRASAAPSRTFVARSSSRRFFRVQLAARRRAERKMVAIRSTYICVRSLYIIQPRLNLC